MRPSGTSTHRRPDRQDGATDASDAPTGGGKIQRPESKKANHDWSMVAIPGSFKHVVEEFTTPFGVRWRCEQNLDLRGTRVGKNARTNPRFPLTSTAPGISANEVRVVAHSGALGRARRLRSARFEPWSGVPQLIGI